MRTYKYPIRTHPKTKRLGNMLDDLADLKRHILTLEQRYYRRYGKYLGRYRLQPLGTLLSMKHKPKSLDFGHYDFVVIGYQLSIKRFLQSVVLT